MHELPLPSYTELSEILANGNSDFQAAEVHGFFAGFLCGKHKKNQSWEKILLTSTNDSELRKLLTQLFNVTQQHFHEFSFEFSLLLPEDETDINTRTEALGLWCQGYLTGLNQSDPPLDLKSNSEIAEAIQDITEISQVSYGDISDSNEDEAAYFELVEYVRLAVLMIFYELNAVHSPQKTNENDQLH